VERDKLSRQREAQTRALALPRGMAQLAELLEDRLLVLGRDADAACQELVVTANS